LGDLFDAFLRLPLMRQRPAPEDRIHPYELGKSIFCREANGGFSTRLSSTPIAAELVEYGSGSQAPTQAKGVRNLLRQDHCLVAPHSPLVRITKTPQRPSVMTTAHHASILPIEKCVGAVLLEIVERDTLRKVCMRGDYCSHAGQGRP
jgi:hypothetical protein